VEIQEIKRIIVAQREEMEDRFRKRRIIRRDIDQERLKRYLSAPNALAILGVRRCGKSTLSYQILRDLEACYINFDDERLLRFTSSDFDRMLQAFYDLYGDFDYLLLDEPHNIPGWELFVSRMRESKRVVLTGSNSKMLSGELSTVLTGRYIDFTLFPFNFREFLVHEGFEPSDIDEYSAKRTSIIKRMLEEFLKTGGFPEAYLFGRDIIVRIYSDIVEKDILRRLRIRKRSTFRDLMAYLTSNFSCEFTMSKLSRAFSIRDVHTIKEWIDGARSAYLMITLMRYSPKLKQQFLAPQKVYSIDTGIAYSMGFRISENIGRLMENLVAVELMRRKSYFNRDWEVFYWKDHQQREVDFLLKQGPVVRQLIQVTYASGRDEVERREIEALVRASEELRCKNLLMITWDYEGEIKAGGREIKAIPMWKWLLQTSS
jgi:predicted AAA+ superfamily ATPase